MTFRDYIRDRFLPHIWCPGCGHGTFVNALTHVMAEMNLDRNSTALLTGIGCSGRMSAYFDLHTAHTLHGRALGYATGVKMAKPNLHVLVPMGDGDAVAIGGNHFIHACRRNIDITSFVLNNRIYGMTGGQYSPLSGVGIRATTAPYETIDPSFNIVDLAMASGASFVARTTTFHVVEMARIIRKAIEHKGFSVVEILGQCPTYFARKNKIGGHIELLEFYRDRTVPLGSKKLEEDGELIPRGIFREEKRLEYCDAYQLAIARARKEA